jgi:hypothetical protein
MFFRHLRDNSVAYVALLVALGGTSYAAVEVANGSITTKKLDKGAVTAPKIRAKAVTDDKIKDGAVTGAKVRDRSLSGADLPVGLVPADGYMVESMAFSSDPVAAPDSLGALSLPITLPRAGTAHVRAFVAQAVLTCSSGSGTAGLYADGTPLPGTGLAMPGPGSDRPMQLVGSIALSAGAHVVTVGVDCSSGTVQSIVGNNPTWTVMLAAE